MLNLYLRWWKDLDFANKLSFARDRVVEGYFWVLGFTLNPNTPLLGRYLPKNTIAIIDDMYDAYGTYEEFEQFADSTKRFIAQV